MQTFLPYPDFAQSARCLDSRRLGKQRVECLQILKALSDSNYGWQNHPAVKMWRGYETGLHNYGAIICKEWMRRGFNDTCLEKISKLGYDTGSYIPHWLNDTFCASHRSNLLRKDPIHYSQFGWTESPDLPYIWPV